MLAKVEECWRAVFDPHVGSYRAGHQLGADDGGVAVIVQELVDARAAGVMFTQHPETGDRSLIVIESSYGLGEAVVGGDVMPDLFEINKITRQQHRARLGSKQIEYRLAADGRGVHPRPVDPARQQAWSTSEQEVMALADMGVALEARLGRGLDVEWAIGTARARTARRLCSRSRSGRSPSTPGSAPGAQSTRRPGRVTTPSATSSGGWPAARRGAVPDERLRHRHRGQQELTGTEAIAAVSAGAASVSDVAARCLAQVADLDPGIGAFRVIDEHGVRSRAKQLDDRVAGPLHGLVVGIKDVIDTADLPTGYGSALFADHQPAADADVVAALRQAGAIVLGKTESTEFAMFQPTRTRNPVDPARTPGGSSSGSAAAVAAGMVPVALGTQTAGSVMRPAAYCGVYGYKPSWSWTSTAGIWLLSENLDTVGLFARCVADLRLIYQALSSAAAGPRPAAAPPAGKPAVAVLSTEDWGPAEGDVRAALSAVAGRLSDDGWEVREMAMPPAWRHLPGQQEVLMAAEVAKNLHAALGDRVGQISDSAQAIVARGDRCLAAEYLAALEARAEAVAVLVPLAGVTDLLLAPSALGAAPVGLDFTGDPVMCRPWTLLGLPAANVPAWRRPDGLPVGVQLIGTRHGDLSYLTNLALAEAALASPAALANQPDLTNPVALTPKED